MNEIVKKLKDEAGLTEEQVLKSLHILKDYIYAKVPPMFSGVVDKFFKDAFPPDKATPQAKPKEDDILD